MVIGQHGKIQLTPSVAFCRPNQTPRHFLQRFRTRCCSPTWIWVIWTNRSKSNHHLRGWSERGMGRGCPRSLQTIPATQSNPWEWSYMTTTIQLAIAHILRLKLSPNCPEGVSHSAHNADSLAPASSHADKTSKLK